jgi:GDPmannose 4,6-dehydratase
MLQQNTPVDYVIATGETHTVREFVELAFKEVGIDIKWKGTGVNEKGIDISNNRVLVEVDNIYFRPAEVELLLGDPTKAEKELGWKRTVSFSDLISEMVQYDLNNDNFGGPE